MIDIHSHILPGIDDGCPTLEDSLVLSRYAVENGISHSVLTPHIHSGRYENNIHTILDAFLILQEALEKNQIPLQIRFAAEVRIGFELIDMLQKDLIPFLGSIDNHKYLLLEMPHSHILPGSHNLIEWLTNNQITPVIAHPERNKELQKNYDKAQQLIDLGCLFQLTSASISGKFGLTCQQASNDFLLKNWVSFVATDAHNLKNRPPDLLQCKSFLIEMLGEKETDNLLIHNAWKIVKKQFS
ncbi:MAG: capsular biosynthesis protein [Pseudomonadota bacterium]